MPEWQNVVKFGHTGCRYHCGMQLMPLCTSEKNEATYLLPHYGSRATPAFLFAWESLVWACRYVTYHLCITYTYQVSHQRATYFGLLSIKRTFTYNLIDDIRQLPIQLEPCWTCLLENVKQLNCLNSLTVTLNFTY